MNNNNHPDLRKLKGKTLGMAALEKFFPGPYRCSPGYGICSEDGFKILDLRGWGRLTGKGCPDHIDEPAFACEVQAAIGAYVADTLSRTKDMQAALMAGLLYEKIRDERLTGEALGHPAGEISARLAAVEKAALELYQTLREKALEPETTDNAAHA